MKELKTESTEKINVKTRRWRAEARRYTGKADSSLRSE